jgi:hypothetical protein
VEDLSSAAAEMANARMAETKKMQEEMRRLRGVQVGDRVKVRVRQGAPYPEPIKRYHYTSPFGGAGLGHKPGAGAGAAAGAAGAGAVDEEEEHEGFGFAGGGGAAEAGAGGKQRRWKIVQTMGYVIKVRGNRVGIKRNGHLEDTDTSFPTYPKEWVEVLDVGEMWEMKTGPRNMGAFASDEDYAQAQQDWADGRDLPKIPCSDAGESAQNADKVP